MTFDELIQTLGAWLAGTGPQAEIVLSSRVRLARNLAHVPFVLRANAAALEDVLTRTQEVVPSTTAFREGLFLRVTDLSEVDRQLLVERRLMSREHMTQPQGRALAISPGEAASLMINEEDHLRLQAMQSGFNLRAAWETSNQIDDELSERLPIAYSSELGYLTCCPTNTGTGLRASVMMHLPALVLTKQINKVLQAIAKLSLTARGFSGEGTEASGNFFQISNQVTLGQEEEDLIENLERVIVQVMEHERNAREALYTQDRVRLEDRISRAFGVLRTAYIISSAEAIDLLSAVRLGVDMGFITQVDRRLVNELFLFTQPAHLQKLEGKKLGTTERDAKRAALIRQRLGGNSAPGASHV